MPATADPATEALLNEPYEVRFDDTGHYMYFVEMKNHLIRRVDLHTGIISTVAGNPESGFAGDDGPALGRAVPPAAQHRARRSRATLCRRHRQPSHSRDRPGRRHDSHDCRHRREETAASMVGQRAGQADLRAACPARRGTHDVDRTARRKQHLAARSRFGRHSSRRRHRQVGLLGRWRPAARRDVQRPQGHRRHGRGRAVHRRHRKPGRSAASIPAPARSTRLPAEDRRREALRSTEAPRSKPRSIARTASAWRRMAACTWAIRTITASAGCGNRRQAAVCRLLLLDAVQGFFRAQIDRLVVHRRRGHAAGIQRVGGQQLVLARRRR